jgi:hypothetical protein
MVGKETTSATTPTRAINCLEILQAVECIANTGLLVLFCSSSRDGKTSEPEDWPYVTQSHYRDLKSGPQPQRLDPRCQFKRTMDHDGNPSTFGKLDHQIFPSRD